MRGRNRNTKGPNPLTRSYESNGPDVKIRGTAQHVAEKYSQLARDAQASSDPVAAENYFQHAEHYYRIIATAQEQLREQFGYQQRPFDEEGDEEAGFPGERAYPNGEDGDFGLQPQPFDNRTDGERQPRFERPERGDRPDRGDRSDRGDRGDRQDRGDRRERFQRGDRGPRQDFQRDDQRQDRGERSDRPERGERTERNDRDRGDRSEFRRDRRRDEREDSEGADAGGLPAFLTNPVPVRQPIAIEADESEAPAAETVANGDANGNGDFRTRRRRRTRGRGLGEDGADGGADLAPEGAEPPPAE
jgi:hypothetical protein